MLTLITRGRSLVAVSREMHFSSVLMQTTAFSMELLLCRSVLLYQCSDVVSLVYDDTFLSH